jgi:hypothetical protein
MSGLTIKHLSAQGIAVCEKSALRNLGSLLDFALVSSVPPLGVVAAKTDLAPLQISKIR